MWYYKYSDRALHQEQWGWSPNSVTGDDAGAESEERKECEREAVMWG